MYRPFTRPYPQLLVAAALALGAAHAFADDSSMSVLTGESYAYFNNLDYSLGKFNVARAPQISDHDTALKPSPSPQHDAMKLQQVPRDATEKPIMLADRPRISLPSPFSDDKGA